MTASLYRLSLLLSAFIVAGAIGIAAPASVAWAQAAQGGGKSEHGAAASKPAGVPGVVVQAPPKPSAIPPEKRAALEAEAAKHKAWKNYRATTPAPTPAGAAGASASARAENYPGLRSLASH